MKYQNIARSLSLCLIGLMASLPLRAEQREWIAADGTTKIQAELVNAYGDTAYFQKPDGGFIHLPLTLLSKPDVARVLLWAQERDAKQHVPYYASQSKVTKDISAQWPNRVVKDTLANENISNLTEPDLYVFLMVKYNAVGIEDTVENLSEVRKTLSAANENFVQMIAISSLTGDDIKPLITTLGKWDDKWLMPNEWAFGDKKDLWNGYWRKPSVSILVVDPQGHVLADSTANEADGKKVNIVDFLKNLVPVAEQISQTGVSVKDPFLNQKAVDELFAKELAAKTTTQGPQPISFNFAGVDPEIYKTMEGQNYVVSMDIGTDGRIHGLTLKKGGDKTIEDALRQAATLWQFLPVLKDGVPQASTAVAPIRVKATAPAK